MTVTDSQVGGMGGGYSPDIPLRTVKLVSFSFQSCQHTIFSSTFLIRYDAGRTLCESEKLLGKICFTVYSFRKVVWEKVTFPSLCFGGHPKVCLCKGEVGEGGGGREGIFSLYSVDISGSQSGKICNNLELYF